MRDLALLDACRPLPGQQLPRELGAEVRGVVTPLRVQEWERALRDHPDKVSRVTDGAMVTMMPQKALATRATQRITAKRKRARHHKLTTYVVAYVSQILTWGACWM